ncbi:MAG: arylsulfatase [Verrucomicrobia bacterium]|nr:arylsulfatase [Verrucomicrobiota bacterium]
MGAVLSAATSWIHAAPSPPQTAPPPNIVFILADDLGYGDLGCYGQKRIRTPHLDRMAAEGMRFTQAYAGSTVCAPSRSVLMTGQHTGHTRIRGNARHPLLPEDVTVAEVLKRRGYRTGLIGKWGLGEAGTTGIPTRQGFDYFFGYLNQHHAHNYYPTFLWRNEQKVRLQNIVPREDSQGGGVASRRLEYSHDLFAAEALAYLEGNRTHPFFLYLAFTLPHANNEAGNKGMEIPNHGAYAVTGWPEPQKGHAAMITRMDQDIGRLFAKLKELAIDERTVVFFSSDNGPHREGGNNPDYQDSNGPLRGIKRDLYEGGIRVPAIVRWPGRIAPGQVSPHVWSFADILSTAAELAGATPPPDTDGISLVPTLLGQPERQRQHECLYWEFYERGSAQAVRLGDWKGVAQPFGGRLELYDLAADLAETNNLASRHPEVVRQIRAAMDRAHVPSPLWTLPASAAKRRAGQ